jgi:uncharacterized protein (DUF4415 family)
MAKNTRKVSQPAPSPAYSQEDWDDVCDNPEWTAEDFANARPFREVFPELAASIDRARGRPRSDNPKRQVSIRLDSDVIEKFKATGKGWQARMNAVLKAAKL